MKNIIITLFIIISTTLSAQKVQDTIAVDGLCGMCKDRIEACLDVKGVWFAEWNVDSKELFVVYKPSKISREEIGALLNEAGHDNEISKASQEQYDSVHGCCKYRDEEVINAHKKGTQKEHHHEEH